MVKKIFLLFVFSLLIFSCKSDKDKTSDSTNDLGPKEMNIVGKIMTISGLVVVEQSGRVVILDKPTSKNMISYIVVSNNVSQLKSYKDQMMTLSLKITKKISDWSYECEFIEIKK